MTAWIVMLKWFGDHAAVEDPVVDIISGRKNEPYVRDHVQLIHDLFFHSFEERADFAIKGSTATKPYVAKIEHQMGGSIIVVGHNPCLIAKKVTNVAVDVDAKTDKEVVSGDGLEVSYVLNFCDVIEASFARLRTYKTL